MKTLLLVLAVIGLSSGFSLDLALQRSSRFIGWVKAQFAKTPPIPGA